MFFPGKAPPKVMFSHLGPPQNLSQRPKTLDLRKEKLLGGKLVRQDAVPLLLCLISRCVVYVQANIGKETASPVVPAHAPRTQTTHFFMRASVVDFVGLSPVLSVLV